MSERGTESGFTLLETVCVLAIIAMLAAIALPAFPHGTSRTALDAFALKTAALLKGDRLAAIRNGAVVQTKLSTVSGTIRSGASGAEVQFPGDVTFSAVLAGQCGGHASGAAIEFLPSGMSCGGTIFLSRPGTAYEIRITWLTGGVEIVPANAP
ncbi:prepilin-type N-terminal cleavage/methylation domain-containing protein [Methylocapsa sp. D3K7]|uniref:prepilin-type N-terminal cleavage/methylation domain-containing protein n=1 Tax=Methylocapsa sp. D3K7 TaxID=3041435 RepID=UPI00244EE761|nr:prepilin-type N-terminal cleavage/methylation domain-containing protein [Methylocapsa sp. D3K7]WGJ13414.1 prepilin-type N-terminal cleavage/methylation domain-containing protein [Methylocapsa sp. D3K7]